MNALKSPQEADTEAASDEQPDPIADESESLAEIPLDVVFGILKNQRRRLVLDYLKESEDSTSLSDLAEHIASIENDKPATELGSQERKRVYVGLYQCHLPRMHDSGAIEFDKNRGTVAAGQNIGQFYEYLDRSEPDATPWSKYYLAHSGLSVALVGGALLLLESLASILFAACIAGFVALALLHATRTSD